ncbi:hypothetical protein SAMN05216582_10911 [Selenomonas ruminantium]|uniref:Uncharacterized protein n=1 Tax=Selenomonas ruminantium TaxID=971 RepID=A0A1M6TSE6_SELRU|nr:hypothetical protein [Selenomonas ruminantium]SHK59830.1 hypothetical protein SAMN05216582_10911 [Selenomonas ruminantium]
MEENRDEGQKKKKRGRNIVVGAIVALVFVLLGAWLARELLVPKAPPPQESVAADTGLIDWQKVLAAHPDYEKYKDMQAECELLELETNDVGELLSLQPPKLMDEPFQESVWQKNAVDVIGSRAELERKAQRLREEYKKNTQADFEARRQAIDAEYLNAILNLNIKLDNQESMHNPLDSKESIAREREDWLNQRSQLQAERGRRQYEMWKAYKAEIEAYVQKVLGPELEKWRSQLPEMKNQQMAAALQKQSEADSRNTEALQKQQEAAVKVQQRLEKRQLLAEKKSELAALEAHILNDVAGKAAKVAILHHFTMILVHHPQTLQSFLPRTSGVDDFAPRDSIAIGIATEDVTDEIVQELKNLQ